jgi:hypothetical protein
MASVIETGALASVGIENSSALPQPKLFCLMKLYQPADSSIPSINLHLSKLFAVDITGYMRRNS